MGREDDDRVTERPEPLVKRVVEVPRPERRLASEVRPPHVVDEQRVTGEEEGVRDEERRAAGRVAGSGQRDDGQNFQPADPNGAIVDQLLDGHRRAFEISGAGVIADPGALRESRSYDLVASLRKLAQLRHQQPVLRSGSDRTLQASAQQLVFARERGDQQLLVAVNMSKEAVSLPLDLPGSSRDLLNPSDAFASLTELKLYPFWGRILQRQAQ